MKSSPPRIAILAAKDLRRNTRVLRQAVSLRRAGWEVVVAALEVPLIPVEAGLDAVRIEVPHPLQRAQRRLAVRNASPPNARPPDHRDDAPEVPGRPIVGRVIRIARNLALPFGHIIASIQFSRRCVFMLDGLDFDVVQAHDATALRAASRLAHRSGARLVYDAVEFVDSRSVFIDTPLARLARRYESSRECRLVRRAAKVFAIGPAMRDWMTERYRIDPPIVVRNCRIFEQAHRDNALRSAADIGTNERVILYPNSITPGRGVEEFLEALKQLDDTVHAVFLGADTRSAYTRKILLLAKRLGLASRVHLLPPCKPEQVVAMAAGADIGVIPFKNTSMNNYYALPNRLFELIMARVPVAASAFPEMKKVIDEHGIGITFDPESVDAMARALRELLAPDELAATRSRLAKAARELCWENESRAYLAALSEV